MERRNSIGMLDSSIQSLKVIKPNEESPQDQSNSIPNRRANRSYSTSSMSYPKFEVHLGKSILEEDEEIDSDLDSQKRKVNKDPQVKPPLAIIIPVEKLNESNQKDVKADVVMKKSKHRSSTEKSKKEKSASPAQQSSIEPAPQILFAGAEQQGQIIKVRRIVKRISKKKIPSRNSKEGSGSNDQSKSKDSVSNESKSSKETVKKANGTSNNPNIENQPHKRHSKSNRRKVSASVDKKVKVNKEPQQSEAPLVPNGGSSFHFQGIAPAPSHDQIPAMHKKTTTQPSKKHDSMDDFYVAILTIPSELAEQNVEPAPIAKQVSNEPETPKLPAIPLPSALTGPPLVPPSRGGLFDKFNGSSPLETIAPTMDPTPNSYLIDAPMDSLNNQNGLFEPIPNYFRFQIPLISRPNDSDIEKRASVDYDIARLLKQAKSN